MIIKTETENEQAADGVLSSWSKRKQAVLREQEEVAQREIEKKLEKELENSEEENLLTDEDMPPIESLTADSDYTCFMSPKVSHALRRLALRKLFHGAEFNICDGLDDYDGDYTSFAKLGDIVTADMKHQIEMEARTKARLLEEQEAREKLENEQLQDAENNAEQAEIDTALTEDELEIENHSASETTNEKLTDGQLSDTRKPDSQKLDRRKLDTRATEAAVEDTEDFDDEDDLDGGLPG